MSQNSWSKLPQSVRDRIRAFVFERDGWVCRVPEPHDCSGRAEELDHIVTRRAAPHLILNPSNCRAACRTGNRGRRPVPFAPSRDW